MHVSFCSYCTIRIPVSKTLTGTYEGVYTYVFEMCYYRTLDIVIYVIANCGICISVKTLKTFKKLKKNYALIRVNYQLDANTCLF